MKLEEIGFYTLSDERAMNLNFKSDLHRCEVVLSEDCNFKCPYCRKLNPKYSGTMTLGRAINLVNMWSDRGLKNIRFSGGEPTMYPNFSYLIGYTGDRGMQRIAISTNGTADLDYYKSLIKLGVDDISFSLDACCASSGDLMSGVKGMWNKVVYNIGQVSKLCYTTVGIVFNEENKDELQSIIHTAILLGVSDIRVIPSAQFNHTKGINIAKPILDKYPILKYRMNNIRRGRNVRGLCKNDSTYCAIVLDDMAVLNEHHFPCIIYLREGGEPIGKVSDSETVRKERIRWYIDHHTHIDPICKANCLDVCIDYNNRVGKFKMTKSIKDNTLI